MLTTLIVSAVVSALMVAGAATYHATDGFGAGNKVKSSLDIKREREARQEAARAEEEVQNSIESNGRFFVNRAKRRDTAPTRTTEATQSSTLTNRTLPTVQTLPTLQTGHYWQEYTKEQFQKREEQAAQSKLFVDRYDTQANNGFVSTSINYLKDRYANGDKWIQGSALPRWALALCTLGFSEIYIDAASLIDNFIWDIDGDGKDSMFKNIFVNPWIEVANGNATWGQALLGTALNYLNGKTEVLDILANPIKGIANNGWQGFLDAFGLGGNGYVAYDWDTGNFALDLLAEIFSDPLTVIKTVKSVTTLGTKASKTVATKAGAKIGQEAAETVGKETTRAALKNITKESTEKLATKLQTEVAPKILNKAGKAMTPATQREVTRLVAQELAQRGITNLSDEAAETIYKTIVEGLENTLGNSKLTAAAIKKLAPETLQQVINETTTQTFKTLSKETADKAMSKLYKAVSKMNVINPKKTSSRASRAYADKLSDIIEKEGKRAGKQLGRGVDAGSVTQIVTDASGKPTLKTYKTVNKIEDSFKISQGFVQSSKEEMFRRVVASAKKANIPITDATLSQIQTATEQFFKNLDLDKMTAQVMSATGIVKKQARILRADKFAGWLGEAARNADLFQSGLNKVALYGVNPAIPLLGIALGNTPVARIIKRGANDLMTVTFAHITNNTAYKFQKAVAEATKELTPETYALMRNAFSWASTEAAETLSDSVKVGSKKVIMENKLLPQTAEGAYQRQWVSKFIKDTRYYDALVRNSKGDVQTVMQDWESYIKREYHKSTTEYLQFMEAINKLEQDASGTAIYSPFIQRIKSNDAYVQTSTLNNAFEDPTLKSKIQFVSPRVKQGNTLSAAQLKEINPNLQVISAKDYNNMQRTLADNQVFIQTDNKVVVEQKLYSEFNKLLDDYDYYKGTKGLWADLKRLSKDAFFEHDEFNTNLELLENKIRDAQGVNRQLELFRANPALYAVVDATNKKAQQEIYVSLADAFMGLNNKIKGLDDVAGVADELAAVAELQIKTRGIIKDAPTGFLTQDPDFMTNLRATLEVYMNTLPNGKFIVSELKDAVPILGNLKSHLDAIEPNVAKQLGDLFDEMQKIRAKTSDEILILPSELYRSGMDIINDASIHEALMKAANGNFAGTLTTIADGVNLGKYFSEVSLQKQFDLAVVENTQRMANGAATIYDRIYYKTTVPEAVARTQASWNDILDTLSRSKIMKKDAYYKQYVEILSSTRNLSADRQYSLMKYLYELDDAPSIALAEIHGIVKDIVESPANAELYRDIKNFMHRTNHPVTVGTGIDIQRARKDFFTDSSQRVIADLTNIMTEAKQIERGTASLENQIKNVSNADPMMIQHLKQTKKLAEFKTNIEHYKELVENAIDDEAIIENLAIAMSPEMSTFLDEDDIITLRDMYTGVENIDPDKIVQLEQRVDAYNKTVISPDYFSYEISKLDFKNASVEDFSEMRRKVSNNVELTKSEQERWKRYKKIAEEYDDFTNLMTKPSLTDKELKRLEIQYGFKMQAYDLTPNAVKAYYTEQYKLANQTRISMNKFLKDGQTSHAGRRIEISAELLTQYPVFQFVYKHETVHSALTFNDLMSHRRQVEQYWNMLMNSENKAVAENLYLAAWWKYKKDPRAAHYFNSDIFTWNNVNIKEEVMANIIAGQHNPKYFQEQLEDYKNFIPKEQLRLWRAEAKPINYSDELIEQNDIIFNSLVENGVNKSPNKILELPQLHEGYRLDINKPFIEVGDMMRDYRRAETNRMRNMLRKRLSQGPEDFAKDLARTGPFQFYSISGIKNTEGRYSLYKYFDEDMNIRTNSKEYKALEAAGVHIKKFDDLDTIMFYIDKDKVAYYKGHSYYNGQRVDYTPIEFDYSAKRWTSIEESGRRFNDAAHEIAGTATGYSNGFRIDENFINTLFNGTKDGFDSEFPSWTGLSKLAKDIGGWTQADLLQPAYFSNYRFNEMIMGDYNYARRFGVYYSSNPMVNMSNALQQMQMMNKSKMEMLTMYFDDMFSIDKGIWGRYFIFPEHPRIEEYANVEDFHKAEKLYEEQQQIYKTKLIDYKTKYKKDYESFKLEYQLNKGFTKNEMEQLFYKDCTLYELYLNHPEMTFVTMRGKTKAKGEFVELVEQTTNKFTKTMLGDGWNPVRIQEFIPYTLKDIARAREMGARFVPRSWFNQMYNTINNRIGSAGVLKYINRYNFIYKFFTLATNAMTFVRNAFDTYLKNTIELGGDMPQWTAYAWKLQSDYQDINNALRELGIHGDKAIKEFFDSGMAKAYTRTDMTYEMFKDLRNYEAWGPSTNGLADIVKTDIMGTGSSKGDIMKYADDIDDATRRAIEPTDDELMRIIARDTVPGYKGVWENAVDMTGQVFDIANNTIGVKAEKVNRLALYMKALSEGKTREQAFHWITKTHFDYSVRNLYEQYMEMLMPFMTFTTKNLEYWLHTIATKPWATKLLMDYFQTQWSYYDFDQEQMAASNQWQFLIKSGNIPLWTRPDGMQAYFKLSPSFADAFNTFINPIEVAKERLFFPTRALEKTFTEDYKGQSLFGKQDAWNKVLDLTSQIPGNALARRITTALKQTDVGSTLGELSGAIGHTKVEGYRPRQYGYKQRIQFVFNRNKENNRQYYNTRLYSQPFRLIQKANNAYKYEQISEQIAKWRRARNLDLGKRVLDPYRSLGQKLSKAIFFRNTLSKTQVNTTKVNTTEVNKRWLSLTQYRVQTALFR